MKDILNIIESVCTVGNLFLLIYFTNREWKHNKEKEKQDKEKEVLERKKLWYDKLVVDRVIDLLMEFFEKSEKILSEPFDDANPVERVYRIRDVGKHYKGLITPYIETIDDGSYLSKEINKLLVEYNDFITQEAEKNRTNISFLAEKGINEKKRDLLKAIYHFDFEHNL